MSNPLSTFLFLNDFIGTLKYRDDLDGSFSKILGMEARIAATALSFAGGFYEAVKGGQIPLSGVGEWLARYGLAGTAVVSITDVAVAAETHGLDSPEYAQALGKLALEAALAVALLSAGVPIASVGIVIASLDILLSWFPEFAQPIGDAIHAAAEYLGNALMQILRDPLVLDLDGDGVELTSLQDSNTHFDFDGDGFAERTGWVSADDGMLVYDQNGNGLVDGIAELFGSSNQDGFAVLETLDSNHDGKIDSHDEAFGKLRVWRDLNQNGVSETNEIFSLAHFEIQSISLARTDVAGTNAGHDIGYGGTFTRTNGTQGIAQTIYFQTDRQDTQQDHTPAFTPAEGVTDLPLLPGSGTINSIAYKATVDAGFRTAWTQLTDQASSMSSSALRAAFEGLLLKWANVEGVPTQSRGEFVDARHLAFVEAFLGDTYREVQSGQEVRTYPGSAIAGARVENSYQQIISLLETVYLTQVARSIMARSVDIQKVIDSPYLFYSLLDLDGETDDPTQDSPGNVKAVVEKIVEYLPTGSGAATAYLMKALLGLEGMITIAFEGDREDYAAALLPSLDAVGDPVLHHIAAAIVDGSAIVGSAGAEGLSGTGEADVFIAGGGGDYIDSGAGGDTIVYAKSDGDLWIRDNGTSAAETDRLVLTDLKASEVNLTRVGDNLVIKVTATGKTIAVEDFFWQDEERAYGIDSIRFADGVEWNRARMKQGSVFQGDTGRNTITDTNLDDVVRGGKGDDLIQIGAGSDTVIYAKGDGNDVVDDRSGSLSERDKLVLADLNPNDVVFSRSGDDLFITIKATGEFIRDKYFFWNSGSVASWKSYSYGFELVRFADGTTWDRDQIQRAAWIRGGAGGDNIVGSGLSETLAGGKGDDVLAGSTGSDTYVWQKGDGNDRFSDLDNSASAIDTLVLKDVRSDDVSLCYQGSTLLITIKSTGEVLELDDVVWNAGNLLTDWNKHTYGIDVIKFADGVTWNRQKIYQQLGVDFIGLTYKFVTLTDWHRIVYQYWYDEFGNKGDILGTFDYGPHDWREGGSSDDHLIGSDGHNRLSGLEGNDVLVGRGGHDILSGGDGNDVLYGDSDTESQTEFGHDILDGGAGDDLLYGGGGLDRLNGGDGNDQLFGGDGKDYLDGGNGNDSFQGGRGGDILRSGVGSDTFYYALGDGSDWLDEESGSTSEVDTLIFTNLNPADLVFQRSGLHLLVTVKSTGEQITIDEQFYSTTSNWGIDIIRFANGEQWDRARIQKEAWYRGTEQSDNIQTSELDDRVYAGKGDDLIDSRGGNDTFYYALGDGNDWINEENGSTSFVDTLVLLDINSSDVTLARTGTHLIVGINTTGEQIVIDEQFYSTTNNWGIEVIRFANGEQWDRARIQQEAWYRGTSIQDTITLSTEDDTVEAGKGDDRINSGVGSDTYVYARGDGSDWINDESGSTIDVDTLWLRDLNVGDVSFNKSGVDLLISVKGTNDVIRIDEHYYSQTGHWGIERIRFADGTEWDWETINFAGTSGTSFYAGGNSDDLIIGSNLSQNLFGNGGNDTLDGKGGNDLLYGGIGNDTLLISQSAAGEIDTLNGGAGIDTASFESFGAAMWVDLVTNGQEARTRDKIDLATGTWRGIAEISGVENITGTAFSDQLFGDASANILIGGAGNDMLDGRSGDDRLVGGTGSDILLGGMDQDMLIGDDGDDTLNGGLGHDMLTGGGGSDVFAFTTGFGKDVITDFTAGAGSDDVIEFSQTIFASLDAVLAASSQVGSDVVIAFDAGNTLTLRGVQLSHLHANDFRFV